MIISENLELYLISLLKMISETDKDRNDNSNIWKLNLGFDMAFLDLKISIYLSHKNLQTISE